MRKMHVKMTVNGKPVEGWPSPRTLLIHFLREDLDLTGPHVGCDTSHCGACTVDMDGKSVKSCTVFVAQADGARGHDHRGHRHPDGTLHALQEAFKEHHGLQCGFCTPGMITRAYRLLQENPNPTEAEIRYGHSGNLCRCTGYQNIVRSIRPPQPKCRRQGGRGMNDQTPTARRTRSRSSGPRLQAQARRGRTLHPRQGPLRRRHQAARDAVRRFRAQPYGHARIKSIDKAKRRWPSPASSPY